MDSALAAPTSVRGVDVYVRRAGGYRASPGRRPSSPQHGTAGDAPGRSTGKGTDAVRDRSQCTQPSRRRMKPVRCGKLGCNFSGSYGIIISMKIATAEFLVSAVSPAQYPRQPLPEVAFAGRSNVGKSSL